MSCDENIFGLMSQLNSTSKSYGLQAITRSTRSTKQLAHLKDIHSAQTEAAAMRYVQALKDGKWRSTYDIECLLGLPVTAANAFLRKLLSLGYLVRRPKGNTPTYVKNRGWEWQITSKAFDKYIKGRRSI